MKCRVCGKNIAKQRLKALPDTKLCVKCSDKVGGDFEVVVFEENLGGSVVNKPLRFKIPRYVED